MPCHEHIYAAMYREGTQRFSICLILVVHMYHHLLHMSRSLPEKDFSRIVADPD